MMVFGCQRSRGSSGTAGRNIAQGPGYADWDFSAFKNIRIAESKEFLAGFWIIDAESTERAYQLAAQVSAAPGPRGKPLNMAIEVRPVMSVSPSEM